MASGWPFLVAPGRRRDYRILLAPDFLVADLDYGILEHVVRPTTVGTPATVVEVRTGGGRRLTIVSATHLLTEADIGGAPRDEHGRPLRLVYGFASPHTGIREPAEADMHSALERAIDVYRRFLADEERADVTPSREFPLYTETAEPPAPAAAVRPRPNTPTLLVAAAVVAGAVLSAILLRPWSHPPAPSPSPTPSISASPSN